MKSLENLRSDINEESYPYFTDDYLQSRLVELEINPNTLLLEGYESLVRELCLTKSSIEEIKLGDITIPSPKNYFLMLAGQYRTGRTGTVVRADGR